MIQGMHHVSMKCSNAEEYAAVRAFYTELLRIPILIIHTHSFCRFLRLTQSA